MRALLLFFALQLAGASPSLTTTQLPAKLFWLERQQPSGVLVVHEYTLEAQPRLTTLNNVRLWSGIDQTDPLDGFYSRSEPDWTLEFLERGLAQLEDYSSAPTSHRAAQQAAREARLGIWASDVAAGPAPPERVLDWNRIREWVVLYGGLGAVIVALIAIFRLVRRVIRRRRVYLIFLGPQSTGKTWLWTRIINPKVSRQTLEQIKQSPRRDLLKGPRPEVMGRYEVRPIYIDLPGGKPGEHLMELLTNKRLRPRKHVWIITLSTTPRQDVTKDSSETDKVDRDYISEQRGYIALPLAVLQARKIRRPAMVIVAITKFDLFADREPNDPSSEPARIFLAQLFAEHIKRIKNECAGRKVPYALEFCSALVGWSVPDLSHDIRDALFPG